MPRSAPPSRARFAAATAIAQACRHFPDIGPIALEAGALSPADRALATAIHRTTLQRWLTLEHLLNRVSKQPMAKMEPPMRAVLLTGAAQLLFLPGVAPYAVVDESVKLAAKLVRPQAKGMTNAVLRKLSAMVGDVAEQEPWTPARDRLPLDSGTLHLSSPALPHPANLVKHLTAATSHPESLVTRWIRQHGPEEATRLCLHSLKNPPTIVVADPPPTGVGWQPHEQVGLTVWAGNHETLREFLDADPRTRRVQDPASFAACGAAGPLQPETILDYCAGLGTKTRQLATMHPQATVTATDVNEQRRLALAELPRLFDNVRVATPQEVLRQSYDLLLLDVPCSNSGVLARRPEARYRLTAQTLEELVALQREIIDRTIDRVSSGGHVLYTTCSIEPEENQQQAQWLVNRTGGQLVSEQLIMPGGSGTSYHDGSYHALVRI